MTDVRTKNETEKYIRYEIKKNKEGDGKPYQEDKVALQTFALAETPR